MIAQAQPTDQVVTVDGVKARVWSAKTTAGTPFFILALGVRCDRKHEVALRREFPVLEHLPARRAPKPPSTDPKAKRVR